MDEHLRPVAVFTCWMITYLNSKFAVLPSYKHKFQVKISKHSS